MSATVHAFPVAPSFTASPVERRAYLAAMREAWLDLADHYLTEAQQASGAGDYLTAEIAMGNVHHALNVARRYRP